MNTNAAPKNATIPLFIRNKGNTPKPRTISKHPAKVTTYVIQTFCLTEFIVSPIITLSPPYLALKSGTLPVFFGFGASGTFDVSDTSSTGSSIDVDSFSSISIPSSSSPS